LLRVKWPRVYNSFILSFHKLAAQRGPCNKDEIASQKPLANDIRIKKGESMKIQSVIDTIIAAVPGAPQPGSVDVFKCGDPSHEVTAIVTTFLATYAVIEKTIALGANLIIAHEPVFYNHIDNVEWLQDDPIYLAKRRLLDEHGITVWRFHDYWHMHQPDGITTGTLRDLGWLNYAGNEQIEVLNFDGKPLNDLVNDIKAKLGVTHVRMVGDTAMLCKRVGLMLGAYGGSNHIAFMRQADLDTLIVGETNEWDTTEYVRDAINLGQPKALVVIGHEKSEEAGMKYLVEWLQPRLPGVSITHVPSGDPFTWL
jgi:putative NIF3 family GTP cyclohydrolase 1 type 2